MNIIIINHYAGSPFLGMEYRPYYMAKHWIEKGHSVTIFAASYSHIRSQNIEVLAETREMDIEGIKYVWVKTSAYKGNGYLRVVNIREFTSYLSGNANEIAKQYKPDLVIASSTYPTDNYPARKIARLANARYFYEVHDLWPLSPMELGGYSKYHPFIVWMQKAENYAYKHCDKVISMLPKTLEHMLEHGLKKEKWVYVPNGINIDDWKNKEPLGPTVRHFLEEHIPKFKHTVAYTGTLGLANAMDHFVQAAAKVNNNDFGFFIFGIGPEEENLKQLASDLNLENLIFMGNIPKSNIPSLLGYFDFLFISLQRKPLFRFGISPNKLMDYMMAGKPIIQAIEAGNNMVEEANCGVAIEPENADAIVEALIKLRAMSKRELEAMGQRGRDYVMKNNDYKILAAKILMAAGER